MSDPAASTSTPAATTPATPAATTPAATGSWRDRVTSKGLKGVTNQAIVLAADVPAFLSSIDPDAPVGKGLQQLQCGLDAQKNLVLTITYQP